MDTEMKCLVRRRGEDRPLPNSHSNFRIWLSTASLIEAIGRPLCDPITDVRVNEIE